MIEEINLGDWHSVTIVRHKEGHVSTMIHSSLLGALHHTRREFRRVDVLGNSILFGIRTRTNPEKSYQSAMGYVNSLKKRVVKVKDLLEKEK